MSGRIYRAALLAPVSQAAMESVYLRLEHPAPRYSLLVSQPRFSPQSRLSHLYRHVSDTSFVRTSLRVRVQTVSCQCQLWIDEWLKMKRLGGEQMYCGAARSPP